MRWAAMLSVVAAIGLCGASQPPLAQKGQPQGAQGQGQGTPAAASQIEAGKPAADASARSAQGAEAKESESLAEERAANRIAIEANRIARDQSRIGFWQLVLGAVVTCLTAVAAWGAISAAIHTKRSADIADAAFAETDRPHFLIYEITIEDFIPPNEGEAPPIVLKYKFKNYGAGVGWITGIGFAFSFMGEGREPPIANITGEFNWPVPPNDWWGNSEGAGLATPVEPILRRETIAGMRTAYLVGRIEYLDAGKRPHEHEFVYEYLPAADRWVPWQNKSRWKYT